jgi:hypothetical protein
LGPKLGNEQLWFIREVVVNQSTEGDVIYEDLQHVSSKGQALHINVRHITQQLRRATGDLHHIVTQEAETCFVSLPAETRKMIEGVLEANYETLVQRLTVLDEVIAQRLESEF